MRTIRTASLVCLICLSSAAIAQSDAGKAFEKMKALRRRMGKEDQRWTHRQRYICSGRGRSFADVATERDEPMMSMFYLDGSSLMMTHFCPSKNQPRMKASISPDGNTSMFDFVDATGLASPDAGHMHRAVYILSDSDHLAEEWTWLQAGKRPTEHFELHRKQ